jgi:hypothetical protein
MQVKGVRCNGSWLYTDSDFANKLTIIGIDDRKAIGIGIDDQET